MCAQNITSTRCSTSIDARSNVMVPFDDASLRVALGRVDERCEAVQKSNGVDAFDPTFKCRYKYNTK